MYIPECLWKIQSPHFYFPRNSDGLVLTSSTWVSFSVAFRANDLNHRVVQVDSIWWVNPQNASTVYFGINPSHHDTHIGHTLSLLKSGKHCSFRVCATCSKIINSHYCFHSWVHKELPVVPLKLNQECVFSVDIHFSGYHINKWILGAVVIHFRSRFSQETSCISKFSPSSS